MLGEWTLSPYESAGAERPGDRLHRQSNAVAGADADLDVLQLAVGADDEVAAVGDQHAHEALLAPRCRISWTLHGLRRRAAGRGASTCP